MGKQADKRTVFYSDTEPGVVKGGKNPAGKPFGRREAVPGTGRQNKERGVPRGGSARRPSNGSQR